VRGYHATLTKLHDPVCDRNVLTEAVLKNKRSQKENHANLVDSSNNGDEAVLIDED
jgi:hypothetical protein